MIKIYEEVCFEIILEGRKIAYSMHQANMHYKTADSYDVINIFISFTNITLPRFLHTKT